MNMNMLKGIVITLVIAVGLVNIYLHDDEIGASNNMIAAAELPTATPPPAVPEVTPVPIVAEEPEPEPPLPEVTPEPEPALPEVTPEPEPEPVLPEVTPEPEPEPVLPEVTPEPEPTPEPALQDFEPSWLTDMIILVGRMENREGYASMGPGLPTEFIRSIHVPRLSSSQTSQETIYFLNGRYSRLEATWRSTDMATLEIFADDRMIYTHVSAGNEDVALSVDVTDCIRLRIVVSSARTTEATIRNPMLIPNPNFVPQESIFAITGIPTWLVGIAPETNRAAHGGHRLNLDTSPGTSNTGELFFNRIHRPVQGRFNADWGLDGTHTRLTGVFTINNVQWGGAGGNTTSLAIDVNGVEVFATTLRQGDLPVPIDIDLTDAISLTVRFDGTHNGVFANAALFE